MPSCFFSNVPKGAQYCQTSVLWAWILGLTASPVFSMAWLKWGIVGGCHKMGDTVFLIQRAPPSSPAAWIGNERETQRPPLCSLDHILCSSAGRTTATPTPVPPTHPAPLLGSLTHCLLVALLGVPGTQFSDPLGLQLKESKAPWKMTQRLWDNKQMTLTWLLRGDALCFPRVF